jgi:hypothetical protein
MGSIPPPTSTPIWVWCRACHPDPAGTAAAGGHHGVHGSAPRRQRPAEPAGSAGRGAGLCGASCISRTAQVRGPFDLSPHRDHSARYLKGPPQVSKRPAELVQHRPAGSTFIRRGSWHSEAHAQTRQARPAARRGQSGAIPRHPQGSRDCLRIPWAMRRPDPRSSVIFWEPGRLFTVASGLSKS